MPSLLNAYERGLWEGFFFVLFVALMVGNINT